MSWSVDEPETAADQSQATPGRGPRGGTTRITKSDWVKKNSCSRSRNPQTIPPGVPDEGRLRLGRTSAVRRSGVSVARAITHRSAEGSCVPSQRRPVPLRKARIAAG